MDGIDATFIGPMDLSMSMGYRGKPFHPEVVKAKNKVLEACEAAGVAPGIAFVKDIDNLNELMQKGFWFIDIGFDINFLKMGCSETLKKIRS